MRFSAAVSVLVTLSVANAMDVSSYENSAESQSKGTYEGTYYSDESDYMAQFMKPVSSQTLKPTGTPVPTALPLTGTPVPTPTPMISTKKETMTSTASNASTETALSTGRADKNTTSYKTSLDASGAIDLSVFGLAMAIGQLFVLF